ncbi:condensin-2 complex subunit H2 isoform X1 [Quercus lobata]|uniref:condensin-2 complex subunit H2 isoform X1 n=1 Tax=Quercus lobata TaxID=97700 RepID=UPI0012444ABC|nr:condensin-2 complex subunit H2 isoform X1 [Quercus lobata]
MSNTREEASASGYHTVQPERDLQSNWEVDLAKKLEDYLFKICSGEIPYDDHAPVNFAEAALLLQGSVQVYSRKVEYLYSLVLRALEFLSQKSRQQDQSEGTSVQPEESGSHAVADEENDLFWGSDDIPVEAKTCLDSPTGKDAHLNHFVKPPANLVVLEGDCLDTTADGGELESYLLATNDLYQDFILLDPCDAAAVDEFFKGDKAGKGQNSAYRGSSARKSFLSPTRRSGGTARKSSIRKSQDPNLIQSPRVGCSIDNNRNVEPNPPSCDNFDDNNCGFDMGDRYSEPRDLDDSDDDDDPWKPLNPHEPGNLRVKPFKKAAKAFRRNKVNSSKGVSISTLFPIARLHGTISPELTEIWEMRSQAFERQREFHSPPLYEKLRQSLTNGGHETFNAFNNPEDDTEDCAYDSGNPHFGEPDSDFPENIYMDEDVPLHNEKHDDGAAHFGTNEDFGHEDPNSHASLEDLCRSHLDALLASIAENEKQTELAARVSTWKQKIEHNLEEQESCPPFDILDYGDRILDKLSLEAHNGNVMSFADVVKGQEKYNVARSFSALLQLVNNGDVDLDRSGVDGKSICYTAVNPFHVRLLSHDKKQEEKQFRFSKKRAKSPIGKECAKSNRNKPGKDKSPANDSSSKEYKSTEGSSQPNCKFSVKLGKISGVRCTPEGKRRRRSRLIEPVDLHSAG